MSDFTVELSASILRKARLKRRAFLFLVSGFLWGGLGLFPTGGRGFASAEVVFAAYNLENYNLGSGPRIHAKSERSRAAIAQVISEVRPDILGLCEVGSMDAVEDLRGRLRASGIDLTEVEIVFGPDEDRHLVLLSRFPLVSRQSRPQVSYELNGVPQLVRRGFLDVTVEIGAKYQLRLVGVHLKSKRPIPEGEAVVRRCESQLLRTHIDAILAAAPSANLMVYGDFNDTRETSVFREVTGVKGNVAGLVDLSSQDLYGDKWTHYWRAADVYSRIDYLLVNKGLWPEICRGSAKVNRSPVWQDASDHRLISVTLLPSDK